jgi:large subunit ribosomal protein L21
MSSFEQAIVRTGGKQYRVEPGAVLRVEKLPGDVGSAIVLPEVLLVGKGETATIGKPLVAGAAVKVTITAHGRGPKLIVYKFRRRKNYRKKNGHRQAYTEIRIEEITG